MLPPLVHDNQAHCTGHSPLPTRHGTRARLMSLTFQSNNIYSGRQQANRTTEHTALTGSRQIASKPHNGTHCTYRQPSDSKQTAKRNTLHLPAAVRQQANRKTEHTALTGSRQTASKPHNGTHCTYRQPSDSKQNAQRNTLHLPAKGRTQRV